MAMRANVRAVVGVAGRALVSLTTWVLAGGGWGLMIGGALEAAAGQGPDGLFEAAGETSLVATGGALLGLFGFGLPLACAPAVGGALGGLLSGLAQRGHPRPARCPSIWHETSARSGAFGGAVGGALVGPVVGVMCGAGLALDALHERPWDYSCLYWLTALGFAAGALRGVFQAGGIIFRALPRPVQDQIRLPVRRPASAA
jgi:hypothetical protein